MSILRFILGGVLLVITAGSLSVAIYLACDAIESWYRVRAGRRAAARELAAAARARAADALLADWARAVRPVRAGAAIYGVPDVRLPDARLGRAAHLPDPDAGHAANADAMLRQAHRALLEREGWEADEFQRDTSIGRDAVTRQERFALHPQDVDGERCDLCGGLLAIAHGHDCAGDAA